MKFRQLELFGEEVPVTSPSPEPVAETVPPPVMELPEVVAIVEEPDVSREPEAEPILTESEPPASAPKVRRSRKPQRQAAKVSTTVELPPDDILYARQYYGIGEVAAMFQVKVSVLRYWESEFEVLDLRKNRKGDRFFRPDDIKTVWLIHHLLRERRFTIEGAREYIRRNARGRERVEAIEVLRRIRGFLVGIRASLESRAASE